MNTLNQGPKLSRNVTRLSHLDVPGAGQIYVMGNYAYIGHITNTERLGTSILDVSDPRRPRTVSQIFLDDSESRTHKARVIGDIMITNVERNTAYLMAIGRKAEQLPPLRVRLTEQLGREPTNTELAEKLGVQESDIPEIEAAESKAYDKGGFKIYDISDKTKPRQIAYQKTGGVGVHRFDMDANYAYISTEMEGYLGNILVNYDIRNPTKPTEVSRWWMPGQHTAGGEQPTWVGKRNRLHHAMRVGDKLWAGCWMAGVRVIDVSDIRSPRTIGAYNYHPPFTEPSHTFMGIPFPIAGRQLAIAIDEEDYMQSEAEMEERRGRPHGFLWVFDVSDLKNVQPLSCFDLSELDSPWSRAAPGRLGPHQFQEHMKDSLVYCAWFAGGLRIVDIADPFAPREVGHFIPEPPAGRAAPQTNDVDVDGRGLVYIIDRWKGLDILEFKRP